MKYRVFRSKRFRKSLKKMIQRGKDINKINDVILKLANGETLAPKYKDHALSGDLEGLRDCHIENDRRLLYFYTARREIAILHFHARVWYTLRQTQKGNPHHVRWTRNRT